MLNLNLNLPNQNNQNELENSFHGIGENDKRLKRIDSLRVFFVTLIICFILLGIGISFYKKSIIKKIDAQTFLFSEKNQNKNLIYFNENISQITTVSDRLSIFNSVFDNKFYIYNILFPILENVVESDANSYVYFNNFSMKKTTSPGIASVSLSGVALNFLSLSKQKDNFLNSSSSLYAKYFLNTKFGSISIGEKNKVLFNVSFDINLSSEAFKSLQADASKNPNLLSTKEADVSPFKVDKTSPDSTINVPTETGTNKNTIPQNTNPATTPQAPTAPKETTEEEIYISF